MNYIHKNVTVSCKRYPPSLPYIIIVQTCGKRWDLSKFVDVLSVNLGFSRLLICIYCHLRFATQPQPNAWWVCIASVCETWTLMAPSHHNPNPRPECTGPPLGWFREQWVINGYDSSICTYLILFNIIFTCWFWFRLPPLALFDSRTAYYKGICSPTRSSNPCKLSNRCCSYSRDHSISAVFISMPRCHCSHMGYGRAQQVLVASCASRWWCCR